MSNIWISLIGLLVLLVIIWRVRVEGDKLNNKGNKK
jgi:hypothetical protein